MHTGYLATVKTARSSDGEIRYARTGAGIPLVLLHTLRVQLEYFFPLVDHLDKSRFDIYIPDLPGHGRSSAAKVDYTAMYFADRIEELLDTWGVHDTVLVGESIGASIALELAARHNPRVSRVVALNPYDYGRRGGIRRSSGLANIVFTVMLWPGVGPVTARVRNKAVLRPILNGGLYDPKHLPETLLEALRESGGLPGHAAAFRSLMRNWRTWIEARSHFSDISMPVTLSYGEDDWSRPAERDANARAIPGVQAVTLSASGHFSSLERPADIARLIEEGP
jgi:pimeloyl-ACP methyl ester carboxylesterase